MSGWFAMKRGLHEHPLFYRQPLRVAAWSWIIATAAWADTKQNAGGKIVTVKRGQLLTSYRQMSEATGVPIKALRVLIGKLQGEDAIGTDTGTGRLIITICNYDKYQAGHHAEGTAKGTPRAQQGHTKETREQEDTLEAKASNGADAPSDPVKVLFDAGIKLFGGAGVKPAQARSIIGKWRKDHGGEAVLIALGNAQRQGAIDPVSFIEASLRASAKRTRDRPPDIGDRRETPDGKTLEWAGGYDGWMEVRS